MAIDDNVTYGLTGAQIKDLASRIEAGGSGGTKTLDYLEYNPTLTANPTKVLGEWLIEKGVEAGDSVVIELNDEEPHDSYLYFLLGSDHSGKSYTTDSFSPLTLYIAKKVYRKDNSYWDLRVEMLKDSNPIQWVWTISQSATYFQEYTILNSSSIKGTGESYYGADMVLSAESGNAISLAANASTNIAGLSKVNVEPLGLVTSGYKGTFTFNQTMRPWDREWRGTAELDSSSPFDFSTAEVGSILAVYIRDTNGVPLNYLNSREITYQLTDTSGNTIAVPGTLKDGGTAKIRIGHLILLKKYDDGWYFTNDGYNATYLQRTIDSGVGVLSTLTTTDKSSAVAAINELNAKLGDIEAALNTLNNGGGAESEPDSEADTPVPVAPMVPPLD